MFVIYDLICLLMIIIYLPVYIFKGKLHAGLKERLGFLPVRHFGNKPVWIHAVSVGEAVSLRNIFSELKTKYPAKDFVVSTVTRAGNRIVRNFTSEKELVTYLPLDFSFVVKKVIDKIDPSLFIIAETELWPNLISYLHRKNVPVIIINGRISDRSYKGYSLIKFLVRPLLDKVACVGTQTQDDAARFVRLGLREDRVRVTGNLKFDQKVSNEDKKAQEALKVKLDLVPADKLFVCGSTHPGEEEIILNAFGQVSPDFPDLRLVIAPRHAERAKEVQKISSRLGFNGIFVSQSVKRCDTCIPKQIYILDSVGSLINLYAIADYVFVGGSLIKKGGHNILEPAIFAKPIIFGPNMFNFKEIADLFIKDDASILVRNEGDLVEALRSLLDDPTKASVLGEKARALLLKNQGATKKDLELIEGYLR